MKTAIAVFANDNKKEITITGQNLTSEEKAPFIHIKDGDKVLMTALINAVVYILFKD